MRVEAGEQLTQYWDRIRGRRAAPERNDFDPGEVRQLLPDIFILDFDLHRQPSIRLAGTRICALFGREISGEPFCALFEEAEQLSMLRLVQGVAQDETPMIAGIEAVFADGARIAHDLLLLPLRHRGLRAQRMLGMIAAAAEMPVFAPAAQSLALVSFHLVDRSAMRRAARTPSLQVGVAPGDIVARKGHLALIDGKRPD